MFVSVHYSAKMCILGCVNLPRGQREPGCRITQPSIHLLAEYRTLTNTRNFTKKKHGLRLRKRGREFTQPSPRFVLRPVHKYCAKEVFSTIHLTGKAGKGKKIERESCCSRMERGKRKRLMAETESEMQRGCGTG